MATLEVKLGRLAKREDRRTLKLENYLTPALAAAPPAADWTIKVQSWPMFKNDTVCDCTCAQAQTQAHEPWDVGTGPDAEPRSWGGHAVPMLAYDQSGCTVITWGAPQKMTWGFLDKYCEEAYALISQDWLNSADNSPAGLDLQQLKSDLANITSPASSSSAGD